tara:strand:+ start:80 stop:406 length:327 start_codon:yes stop_codon:yes gene_type:complete
LGIEKKEMKKKLILHCQLMGILLGLTACRSYQRMKLEKSEVVEIAETAIVNQGYEINKYDMTGCHFEYTVRNQTWSVFYEQKAPTPPGAHFIVLVDDQTRKATVAHGQ